MTQMHRYLLGNLLSFWTVLMVPGIPGQEDITFIERPRDTFAYVGQGAVLACRVQNANKANVTWTEFASSPEGKVVASTYGEQSQGKYIMTTDGATGDYQLQLTDVKLTDAGRYQCEASGETSIKASAWITVLEKPRCFVDPGGVVHYPADNGSDVTISYSATYNSSVIPTLFLNQEMIAKVGISRIQSAWTQHLQATSDKHMWKFSFMLLFGPHKPSNGTDAMGEVGSDEAQKGFADVCNVTLYVAYREPISIQPNKTSYSVGDTIVCQSECFPHCAMSWVKVTGQGERKVRQGGTLEITSELQGFNHFICLASNLVRGIPQAEAKEFKFNVRGAATPSPTPHPCESFVLDTAHPHNILLLAIASYAAVLSIAFAVVIACILWKKRPRKKFVPNRDVDDYHPAAQLTRKDSIDSDDGDVAAGPVYVGTEGDVYYYNPKERKKDEESRSLVLEEHVIDGTEPAANKHTTPLKKTAKKSRAPSREEPHLDADREDSDDSDDVISGKTGKHRNNPSRYRSPAKGMPHNTREYPSPGLYSKIRNSHPTAL